jgi:Uncharacterized protein containing LysM domain
MAKRYGIWLSWNNQQEGFELPVLPGEIGASLRGDGAEHEVYGLGKINVIKHRGLAEYTIESIFPVVWYDPATDRYFPPYVTASRVLDKPIDYVRFIEKWWATNRPIRFIYVGANAYVDDQGNTISSEINTPVSIESFEWKEVAGSPGDISFSLKLKEYRFYAAKRVEADPASVQKPKPTRPDERVPPQTYTLVAGDSLWKVAQKVLGDGNRWREIQQLNGISDAQLRKLPVGMVLKLPTGGR